MMMNPSDILAPLLFFRAAPKLDRKWLKKCKKINHGNFLRWDEALTLAVSNSSIEVGYSYAWRLMVLSITKQFADGSLTVATPFLAESHRRLPRQRSVMLNLGFT